MYLNNWGKYAEKFNNNDEEIMKQLIPNEKAMAWMEKQVPRFECSDQSIEEIYYFRWWVFRKHIKDTKEGRIITEFLPEVSWSGPYNSINCANGHHLAEARWLIEDKSLTEEYIKFWFRGSGNEFSYSSWIIDTIYELALVTNNKRLAVEMLNDFIWFYKEVERRNLTRYGLFWSFDDRDAMEMSISGSGLRPTLNSYMYANAAAISEIARWAGRYNISIEYAEKAQHIKEKLLADLWDDQAEFFKVIPQKKKDDEIITKCFKEIPKDHNVRESIGYIPWSFGIPDEDYDVAWKFLMDEDYFKAPYGPTTAEKNHPEFMKPCESHECLWNGPSWPYATTQILNSMVKVLQSRNTEWLTRQDFLETLQIYARSHYRVREDGVTINWLDENIEPDSGKWLSREILKNWSWREDKGGYERGKDYNHSAFCDIIIRGICGLQITVEEEIVIDSLLPIETWDYFMIENLIYKNHKLTIAYDRENKRYQKGKGLWVEVDDKIVAGSSELEKLVIKL